MTPSRLTFRRHRILLLAFASLCLIALPCTTASSALAQCPADTTIQNHLGLAGTPCPCFNPDEEAGSVFTPPAEHYPLEVLSVGVFWASQFGGAFDQLENAIRVYAGGLPDPGAFIAELQGPVLKDGFLNDFNLTGLPGEIIVNSGPITATLKFLNQNANQVFNPTVAYDANCQGGKNVVFAIPGGWGDGCLLGVPGDWIFTMKYRPCVTPTGVGDDPIVIANTPAALMPPQPNPVRVTADMQFFLAAAQRTTIKIFDVAGRQVASLADADYPEGAHHVRWAPSSTLKAGVYFAEMVAGPHRVTQKIVYQP